jgi:acyl-CoA synthetase (AMP-forming)/AMP-acid ligase II
MTAGAPVRPVILETMRRILSPDADIHTPYGATEALPVATIESREILNECRARTDMGQGTCVGKPLPGLDIRIISITDDPISTFDDSLLVSNGTIGEIIVRGPIATRHYYNNPTADRLAKILHPDGSHWHRMGDLGWMDDAGRIWFCGRKNHRVVTESATLFTIPVEARFNLHPDVARTALVGVGPRPNQRPVLCVELRPGRRRQWKRIEGELRSMAQAEPCLQSVQDFLPCRTFPVDIRHNAKIFREQLAVWAARKFGVRDWNGQ